MNASTNPSLSDAWDGYAFETFGLCYWEEEAQGSQKKFLCQEVQMGKEVGKMYSVIKMMMMMMVMMIEMQIEATRSSNGNGGKVNKCCGEKYNQRRGGGGDRYQSSATIGC